MSMVVTGNGPVVFDLIRAEGNDRDRYLGALIRELEAIGKEWAGSAKTLIAADTNVFLHQDKFFDKIGWTALVGSANVRLMVPSVVLRELDRHKNGQRNAVVSDSCPETVRGQSHQDESSDTRAAT